jgi:phosphoglycerate kinase
MVKDFLSIDDLDVKDKTILVRLDVNSPLDPVSGHLLDDARMQSHVQTLRDLRKGKVVILAHQSRPGKNDFVRLGDHAKHLSTLIKNPVKYVDDLCGAKAINAIKRMNSGDVVLLENVRFYAEEIALKKAGIETQKKCHIVKELSCVADYYVNDAFAAAHRSQPSLTGFPYVMPAAAGRVMEKELVMLNKLLNSKGKNNVVVLGGLKVDDSIAIMSHMFEMEIASKILAIGAVGNVFLHASGIDIGKKNISFMEKEMDDYSKCKKTAASLIKKYGDAIEMPTDVVANENGLRHSVSVEELPTEYPIYDIGLNTIAHFAGVIKNADDVILNGPAGVFELQNFALGTIEIFNSVAKCKGFSVVGGGHTAALFRQLGFADMISHISTGGGALINFLSGKKMPVVEALRASKKMYKDGEFSC